jgi:NAD-dependent SIR2 family protein deacetylase
MIAVIQRESLWMDVMTETVELITAITLATEAIDEADGILITAGAGMGVDSGLPDFRGTDGFWGAYPALGRAGMRFSDIANPQAFLDQPRLAWGFYGHRLALYRQTVPNEGFHILRQIAARKRHGAFVFTSNVDGHFQAAGFEAGNICETHGSIHHLQCMDGCRGAIWPATDFKPAVDEAECWLTNEPPVCPYCGGIARPNILMFGDWGWLDSRERLQMQNLRKWHDLADRITVIEIGAGTAIPTVRRFGQDIGGRLVRINLSESDLSRPKDVRIPLRGLDALQRIGAKLGI